MVTRPFQRFGAPLTTSQHSLSLLPLCKRLVTPERKGHRVYGQDMVHSILGHYLLSNQVEQIWFFRRKNLSLCALWDCTLLYYLHSFSFNDSLTLQGQIQFKERYMKAKYKFSHTSLCMTKGTYEFLARYIWPASHRLQTLPIQVWKNWNSIFVYF